jgi:hypothetical protein
MRWELTATKDGVVVWRTFTRDQYVSELFSGLATCGGYAFKARPMYKGERAKSAVMCPTKTGPHLIIHNHFIMNGRRFYVA